MKTKQILKILLKTAFKYLDICNTRGCQNPTPIS